MKPLLALAALASVLGLAACSASTTAPPPTSFHVYTADFANPGTVSIFTAPLTSSSVPSGSFAGNSEPASMIADSTNRLFVTNFGSDTVQVFAPPIANGATPAFSLSTPGLQAEDAAFDKTGNLFVVGLGSFAHFSAPITSSSTVDFSIVNPGPLGARGIALDSVTGNLWTNDNTHISEFTPPYSSGSTPALQFASTGNGHGIAVNGGVIYAAGNAGVDVFKPPFSVSSTPAFTIPIAGGANATSYLKFDTAGNLYVTTGGNLYVFVPPFSATSAPVVTTALPGLPSIRGIGIGP